MKHISSSLEESTQFPEACVTHAAPDINLAPLCDTSPMRYAAAQSPQGIPFIIRALSALVDYAYFALACFDFVNRRAQRLARKQRCR